MTARLSRSTRLARLSAVVVGLATASLALSGCVFADIGTTTQAAPTAGAEPVTDGVPDELLPFYDQRLEWEDCAESFQCRTGRTPTPARSTSP
jgi:hypothetical protein